MRSCPPGETRTSYSDECRLSLLSRRRSEVWTSDKKHRNLQLDPRLAFADHGTGQSLQTYRVGSFLIEIHDEWAVSDRRYLSEGSMKTITSTPSKEVAPTPP